jgi:phosphoglycerate dehydrogenase-like enzyme
MSKVLITPRSLTRDGHPSLELLKEAGYDVVFSKPGKQPTEEELVALLPGCVGYLAGVEKITAAAIAAAEELRVISRNGSGIDNIDLAAAEKNGIAICKTEGANAKGVAELTIALMFGLARSVAYHDAKMKDEAWERRKGIELEDRTLGLIGCGQIGKETALRALGLGMKVLACRRNPDRSFTPSDKFEWVTIDELVERSAVISLHRPANPDGTPVVTAELIAQMCDGVLIINTARASLIDEAAVLDGLDSGRVGGFATDVYDVEPPQDYRMVKHQRVVSTPHIGGFTLESVDRATTEAVRNIIESLK